MQITQHVRAPRAAVYRAMTDAKAVQRWQVPDDMTSAVHEFDAREGGAFRISLTYAGDGKGKSNAHTDTFHGRFVTLAPDLIVQTMAFETDDPQMQGEMTATYRLVEADGETDIIATHDNVPPGVSPEDNETGWRMSLGKLARLVESAS